MKAYIVLGTVLLACSSMLAQSSEPSQPAGQSTGMQSDMQMGSAQKSKDMSGMNSPMEGMQADMQSMKAQIEKLRSDAQKVQDASTKTALLDNVDLWEQCMNRMQSHMDMMMSGKKGMMHCQKPKKSEDPTSTPKKK